MQNPSALIHSHDIITLSDEVEGLWFLTISMGDMTPPTEKIGSVYTISHHKQSIQWGILR